MSWRRRSFAACHASHSQSCIQRVWVCACAQASKRVWWKNTYLKVISHTYVAFWISEWAVFWGFRKWTTFRVLRKMDQKHKSKKQNRAFRVGYNFARSDQNRHMGYNYCRSRYSGTIAQKYPKNTSKIPQKYLKHPKYCYGFFIFRCLVFLFIYLFITSALVRLMMEVK